MEKQPRLFALTSATPGYMLIHRSQTLNMENVSWIGMSFEIEGVPESGGIGDSRSRCRTSSSPISAKGDFTYVVVLAVLIWLATGIYTVGPDQKGVVLRFGMLNAITDPGLNYHLPYPIETVFTPKVTEVKRVEIGFRTIDPGPPARYADRPHESLMLTGDENIVDIDLIVQYLISDPAKFLFQVRDPNGTVAGRRGSRPPRSGGQQGHRRSPDHGEAANPGGNHGAHPENSG